MDNEKSMRLVFEKDDFGKVYASEDVFAAVIAIAAKEEKGVHSLADGSSNEAAAKLSAKALSRCVRTNFGENEVSVAVSINLSFGSTIPDVSSRVQDKIKEAIQNMIGFRVKTVNVFVADVIIG